MKSVEVNGDQVRVYVDTNLDVFAVRGISK